MFRDQANDDLKQKMEQIDLQLKLESDQNLIKKQTEEQRLVKELNVTAEKILQNKLENDKIKQESANEIKLAMMELEKSNMDEKMLQHEAIQLARKSYAGKYVETTRITNMA